MLTEIHAALLAHPCFEDPSPKPILHPRSITIPSYHDGQFDYPEIRIVQRVDDLIAVFVAGKLVDRFKPSAVTDIVQAAVTF